MKYIRTEGGVYEFEKRIGNEFHLRSSDCLGFVVVLKEGEYEEADTIEELCDEFVYEYQTGARVINKKIIAMPDIVKTYGAIWTEKGLIYVAKMNKKGEFELL